MKFLPTASRIDRDVIAPILAAIGSFDRVEIVGSGRQMLIFDGVEPKAIELISRDATSEISFCARDGLKETLVAARQDIVAPIWRALTIELIAKERQQRSQCPLPVILAKAADNSRPLVVAGALLLMIVAAYSFNGHGAKTASTPTVATATQTRSRLETLKMAEELLKELGQAPAGMTSTGPLALPPAAINPGTPNRYGISDVPAADSWAARSKIILPLPGGGDIKSPADFAQFGLQP